jgi:hypothetical protein
VILLMVDLITLRLTGTNLIRKYRLLRSSMIRTQRSYRAVHETTKLSFSVLTSKPTQAILRRYIAAGLESLSLINRRQRVWVSNILPQSILRTSTNFEDLHYFITYH